MQVQLKVVIADPGASGMAMAKLLHPDADIIVQRSRTKPA